MYILDTKLKENEIITTGLTRIFGIGKKSSLKICKKIGLSKNTKAKSLPKNKIDQLNNLLYDEFRHKVSNELKKIQAFQFQKLLSIKCNRALRKLKGLPVRGQRTHTNGRTTKRYRKQ